MTAEQRQAKIRAGRAGGLRTLELYGRQHYVELGKKGAKSLYERYELLPFALANYCLVDKSTREIKAIW